MGAHGQTRAQVDLGGRGLVHVRAVGRGGDVDIAERRQGGEEGKGGQGDTEEIINGSALL